MSEFAVQFLTRPGCHLCDEARVLVNEAALRTGVAVIEVDIETEDSLIRDFGLRIPIVLSPDGSVVAEGEFDPRNLRRQMRKLRSTFR
ncbi:MAG TPA: glutaredoxin family protein [Acidimicrobiia bacterium]